MTKNYSYRPPLGFDIRVKPPKKEAAARAAVHTCAVPGCNSKGEHRAPVKAGGQDFQWLCLEHVREFNKSWNYFKDMDEGDVKRYIKDAETGHRPTWSMGDKSRGGEGVRTGGFGHDANINDPHRIFEGDSETSSQASAPKRSLTKRQREALETLDLGDSASVEEIKMKYKALVKRYHPDTNGGDTGAVERLKRVIHAYNVLKSASFWSR